MIGRLWLALSALLYVAFGFRSMVDPASRTGVNQIALEAPAAFADARAIFGGLTIGLGVLFLAGATGRVDPRACLWALLLTCLFPALGRAAGIVFDGADTAVIYRMFAVESAFVVITGLALFLERPRS